MPEEEPSGSSVARLDSASHRAADRCRLIADARAGCWLLNFQRSSAHL